MSELFDKQVNAQKEKLLRFIQVSRKPMKKCVMKMKETKKKKTTGRLKYFRWKEEVYKVRVENSCHGYQMTLGQQFFMHRRYYLFSK